MSAVILKTFGRMLTDDEINQKPDFYIYRPKNLLFKFVGFSPALSLQTRKTHALAEAAKRTLRREIVVEGTGKAAGTKITIGSSEPDLHTILVHPEELTFKAPAKNPRRAKKRKVGGTKRKKG